jgi:hypothetical protein
MSWAAPQGGDGDDDDAHFLPAGWTAWSPNEADFHSEFVGGDGTDYCAVVRRRCDDAGTIFIPPAHKHAFCNPKVAGGMANLTRMVGDGLYGCFSGAVHKMAGMELVPGNQGRRAGSMPMPPCWRCESAQFVQIKDSMAGKVQKVYGLDGLHLCASYKYCCEACPSE